MLLPRPEPQIPGIGILIDPEKFADLLSRLKPHACVGSTTITYVRYKPCTSCLVGFRSAIDGQFNLFHAKAYRTDNWPEQIHKAQQFKLKYKSAPIWSVDQITCNVFEFPIDWQLPALKRLNERPASVLGQTWHPGKSIVSIEPVSYKPNRRFVGRITAQDNRQLLVKLYDAKSFERALATLRRLKRLGLPIPRPCGQSRRHRALVFPWFENTFNFGQLLPTINDRQKRRQLVLAVCQKLIELHETRVKQNVPGLRDHFPDSRIENIGNYLGSILSSHRIEITDIAGRLRELTRRMESRRCLIHGDFHPGQVLVDGKRCITICDLDSACLGDPLADFANICAHLTVDGLLGEIDRRMCQETTDDFTEFSGALEDDEYRNRFRVHWLIALFRLATKPFRTGRTDWMEVTKQLFDKIAAGLEEVSSSGGSRSECRNGQLAPGTSLSDLHGDTLMADESMPYAKSMLEFDTANRELCNALSANQHPVTSNQLDLVGIHVIRHKPGRRCLIGFEVSRGSKRHSIIGKSRAKGLDKRTYRNCLLLHDQFGFGEGSLDRVSVPRPLATIPRWNMWLQTAIRGSTVEESIRCRSPAELAERIVRAINKLHECGLKPHRKHGIDREMEILHQQIGGLTAARPELESRLDPVVRGCQEISKILRDGPSKCIHRDFYHDHVLFASNRTFLLDLDLFSQGHPAIDYGNFLAHLIELAIRVYGNPQHFVNLEEELVERAIQKGNIEPRCLTAAKILSLTRLIAISHRISDRRSHTTDLLDHVERYMNRCLVALS